VAELRAQGIPGLSVASASAEAAAVAEAADVAVDGPAGVVALLSRLAAALRRSDENGTG
jgi:trehalose 6-phosphate phosphatase